MSRQLQTLTKDTSQPSFTPAPTRLLQRQCACGQHTGGGECEECHKKSEGTLQRAAVSPTPINSVPPIVHEVLNSPGQPLDAGTRTFMESRFSHDFSQVRLHATLPGKTYMTLTVNEPGDQYEQEADQVADMVTHLPMPQVIDSKISQRSPSALHDFSQVHIHTDSRAAESARSISAQAYTLGQHIVFGAGKYAPNSLKGRQLLAHELTHAVQQKGGNLESASIQLKPEINVTNGTTEELQSELDRLQKEKEAAPSSEVEQYEALIKKLESRIAERGNSTLADCPISLRFDGKVLMITGAKNQTFPAVSGRPINVDGSPEFDYSPERQKLESVGPIPEGVYWLDPSQIRYLLFYSEGWGNARITIHPFNTTHSFGRGGFFIHGGSVPGSAGCIDLTNNMDAFAAVIRNYRNCKIILSVQYPEPGDFPLPPENQRMGDIPSIDTNSAQSA